MRFAVANLGCRVNRVESDGIIAVLQARGHECVEPREATVAFINTCTVTAESDKKTRKTMRRILAFPQVEKLYITGCSAALRTDELCDIDERVEYIPKAELRLFLESELFGDESASAAPQPVIRVGDNFPMRAGIKIQDGCNNACTYCAIHTARGPVRCKETERALAEIAAYFEAGVREVVLTGIDLGAYNSDGLGLEGLLREILRVMPDYGSDGDPAYRVRLSSIESPAITPSLIELLATSGGRICRHLHLPLQAGSTKVLQEMARRYTTDDYLALVTRLREAIPELSLTTDIICGFPGEADEEFAETLALARVCAFSKIHVFPYSKRAGTPAAERTDQIPADVKSDRVQQLLSLSDELRAADFAKRFGTREFVLVESPGIAKTESYFSIEAPEGAAVGSLVPTSIPERFIEE